MNGSLFSVAILFTIVTTAGFVVWYDDSGRASPGGVVNLVQASHAFLIGVVALITAIVAGSLHYVPLRAEESPQLCNPITYWCHSTRTQTRIDILPLSLNK